MAEQRADETGQLGVLLGASLARAREEAIRAAGGRR